MKLQEFKQVFNLTVWVAGLGYFVDLFDITLFGVVRVSSLQSLGITDPDLILSEGLKIYNFQMLGMMIGGIFWGMLADKKGRLSVMFGSILLYSVANIANIFVWDANSYAVCRFFGGIGLAGELGAAITLVAESLPKEKRGLGTAFVAALGMFRIVAAATIGQMIPWQASYAVGGVMGLALLVARMKVLESELFEKSKSHHSRGHLSLLLKPERLKTYLGCIMIGIPVYFTTGVLWTFAPELTKGLGIQGVTAGNAILWGSLGLSLGDLFSGILSQHFKSRKKAIAFGLSLALVVMILYTTGTASSVSMIYFYCFVIGLGVGYWAVLMTMAAEQFGTNIRGTVTTTVPNFVRGSAVFAVSGFATLKNYLDVSTAALSVGFVCFGLAFLTLSLLPETFNRNLDYLED